MERSEKLARMGFATYSDYLASDLWAAIRTRVLERDNCTCCVCKREAETVHHKKYDDATMDGRRIDTMVSLCNACHYAIEFGDCGNKTGLREANRRLARLVKSFAVIAERKAKLMKKQPLRLKWRVQR